MSIKRKENRETERFLVLQADFPAHSASIAEFGADSPLDNIRLLYYYYYEQMSIINRMANNA